MSLQRLACDIVHQLGRATVDDVYPRLVDFGFTRPQVIKALHNAKSQGQLHCDGRSSRLGVARGNPCPAMFFPGPDPERRAARERRVIARHPMVASVFDLADPKTTWPDPPAVRKINTPLGPWNTEGA
jgi:hypothetical protein